MVWSVYVVYDYTCIVCRAHSSIHVALYATTPQSHKKNKSTGAGGGAGVGFEKPTARLIESLTVEELDGAAVEVSVYVYMCDVCIYLCVCMVCVRFYICVCR